MRFFLDTLGCPKANVDAERVSYFLQEQGLEMVFHPQDADVIVVNTCAFIEPAREQSIDAILGYAELKKSRPSVRLIVSGCLSERYRGELLNAIPEIDSCIGVRDFSRIVDALNKNSSIPLDDGEYRDTSFTYERTLMFSGLHYAYLKISEGCDRQCSFCAIPSIRGAQRSRPIENILDEAEYLLNQGVRELILIAEDTTSYGIDLYGKVSIIRLLNELVRMDFDWIRLMYLFPDSVLDEIVDLMMENPRICSYLDIPLQHVSPAILRAMRRPGSYDDYLAMIERYRKKIPQISIRSAFILGFPGENTEDLALLHRFLKEARLDRVGFFAYSDEEGTPAYQLRDKLKPAVIRKRVESAYHTQEAISREKLNSKLGTRLRCINDGKMVQLNGKVYYVTRSQYDAPEIDGVIYIENSLIDNEYFDFIDVRITDVYDDHDLIGEPIE